MQAFNDALHTVVVVVVVVDVLLKLTIGAAPNGGAPSPTSRPKSATHQHQPHCHNQPHDPWTSLTGCYSKATRHTTPSKPV